MRSSVIVQNSSEFFVTAEFTESCKYFTLTKLYFSTVQFMLRWWLSWTIYVLIIEFKEKRNIKLGKKKGSERCNERSSFSLDQTLL